MNRSLHESLKQLVQGGYFIKQIKKTLDRHVVAVSDFDYQELHRRLCLIASPKKKWIHEKTTEIVGELESFTSSVKYIMDFKRDDRIFPDE